MIDWFLGLTSVYRILMLAVFLFFLFLIAPGFKCNMRNLLKAMIFIFAVLLLYSLYSGETPPALLQRATEQTNEQNTPITVPKYYEDPEKRWQQNQ